MIELACDGIVPLWLSEAMGISNSDKVYRRKLNIAPTGRSRQLIQVQAVSWSSSELASPIHLVRHVMMTSVARYVLQAQPSQWDNLVIRTTRKSPRGRKWASDHFDVLRGKNFSRPDAELWLGNSPIAVEVDSGKHSLDAMVKRIISWSKLYSEVYWVLFSSLRQEKIMNKLQSLNQGKYMHYIVLPCWWSPVRPL